MRANPHAKEFSVEWSELCAPTAPAVEPGEPDKPICGDAVAPVAKSGLLQEADYTVLKAIFGGYAHCGHMVEGAGVAAGTTIHRVYVCWAPATIYAVLHATRCGPTEGSTAQTQTAVGVPGSVTTTVQSPFCTPETYMETGTAFAATTIVMTGTGKSGLGAAGDYIAISAARTSTVTLYQVEYVAGFCFEPREFTYDLSTLP